MRRIALLACALALAVLPASASAAITPTDDAPTLATALDSAEPAGANFAERPPTAAGAPNPYATVDSTLAGFPTAGGSFAVLTNGDASLVDGAQDLNASTSLGGTVSHGFAGAPGNAYDTSTLRIPFTATGPRCLTFSYRFFSEEFPEFVGQNVSDGFVAELDGSTLSTDENGDVSDPRNFALDETGSLVSVNTASFSEANAAGTIYDGATGTLTARTSVTSGAHTLYLTIFDQGDDILDSAVFIDSLTVGAVGAGCASRSDFTAPAVSIAAPASGATVASPAELSGNAGVGASDSNVVTVQVYAGSSIAGTPVDIESASRVGSAWQTESDLAPGTYTAQAHQTDRSGNAGVSAPRTFTVGEPSDGGGTPPSPPGPSTPPTPQPKQGKTVVAGLVSGKVRVRLKNGKFKTLRANQSIPLGSTIDATRGRVRLTSAAGGGKTQTADFYKGQFKITQTKGKKPITQLELNGTLSCAKASAAAKKKKKVRSLWGDGKGRFRTKGRRAAATVRGTKWFTQDTCTSTKITVKRGVVQVRDFVKRKNVTVKKGHSYVARKKRK